MDTRTLVLFFPRGQKFIIVILLTEINIAKFQQLQYRVSIHSKWILGTNIFAVKHRIEDSGKDLQKSIF